MQRGGKLGVAFRSTAHLRGAPLTVHSRNVSTVRRGELRRRSRLTPQRSAVQRRPTVRVACARVRTRGEQRGDDVLQAARRGDVQRSVAVP